MKTKELIELADKLIDSLIAIERLKAENEKLRAENKIYKEFYDANVNFKK